MSRFVGEGFAYNPEHIVLSLFCYFETARKQINEERWMKCI